MSTKISIIPIVFEAHQSGGTIVFSSCTATVIDNGGTILTCAHFCNNLIKQFDKSSKLYKHYMSEVSKIKMMPVSDIIRRTLISKLKFDPEWYIDMKIYIVAEDKTYPLKTGDFYFCEDQDIAIIKRTGVGPIEELNDFVVTKDALPNSKAQLFGYVFKTGSRLSFSNYQLVILDGLVLQPTKTSVPGNSNLCDFNYFSKGAHLGMSGGPYISQDGLIGIQSMTTGMDKNKKVTVSSQSLFVKASSIREEIEKSMSIDRNSESINKDKVIIVDQSDS